MVHIVITITCLMIGKMFVIYVKHLWIQIGPIATVSSAKLVRIGCFPHVLSVGAEVQVSFMKAYVLIVDIEKISHVVNVGTEVSYIKVYVLIVEKAIHVPHVEITKMMEQCVKIATV